MFPEKNVTSSKSRQVQIAVAEIVHLATLDECSKDAVMMIPRTCAVGWSDSGVTKSFPNNGGQIPDIAFACVGNSRVLAMNVEAEAVWMRDG